MHHNRLEIRERNVWNAARCFREDCPSSKHNTGSDFGSSPLTSGVSKVILDVISPSKKAGESRVFVKNNIWRKYTSLKTTHIHSTKSIHPNLSRPIPAPESCEN